ncbi:ATP-grasp domain-containing protein [Agathobacter ruminis]|uniref:ATP-grasp domain-containing protein n=1 Tax=Agathobacter ruminis TaxID=1712665 RepID=A0A2G3E4J5_9FIRM|nr:ATP-grasp domain-containing protein [Agathobacter ruminis]MDC7302038.1 ATP-grasp domain-containing protein [Agathobacter ruminis]PHU38217.1 hypothetical protein CSX02_04190 [Agathobacter ruminis]
MRENGLRVPEAKGFTSEEKEDARAFFESIEKPVVIKPVDASGSKGVSKVYKAEEFDEAWETACQSSRSGNLVIESFIEKKVYHISGEEFALEGKLVFAGLLNGNRDRLCNPLVPIGESYPHVLDDSLRQKVYDEIQKFISAVGYRQGVLNLDIIRFDMFVEKGTAVK